jgi:hypothetical protein
VVERQNRENRGGRRGDENPKGEAAIIRINQGRRGVTPKDESQGSARSRSLGKFRILDLQLDQATSLNRIHIGFRLIYVQGNNFIFK